MNPLRIVTLLLSLSSLASGVVLTLGPSAQTVTFTGTGQNVSGLGTARISWGNCTFDGANTTCTVSGPYTGLGSGGTYAFVHTYQGNGASTLSAVQQQAGSDNVFFNLSQGNFTFTVTPNGGGAPVSFASLPFSMFFDPATESCTGVSNCSVGPVTISNGGTIKGPVHGQFDATPLITSPGGVLTAGAYGGSSSIAPATWIEIYGTNLATNLAIGQGHTWAGGDFNGVQAPTSLGGTTVTIGGKSAFVDFVSPGQVNAQVPSGVATGFQPVVVTTFAGSSVSFSANVKAVEPGILAPPVFKLAAGQYVAALLSDGVTFVLPPGVTSGVPTARAKPGDIILVYGVGFGTVTPDIPAGQIVQQANALSGFAASIGGTNAEIKFAGLVSGYLGLYQFNIVVPQVAANDAAPFVFTLNGVAGTQKMILPVGN